MDEFKFVMKCFLFACLLVTLSQMQTEGVTIESKVEVFLLDSKPAQFMQSAAAGGVKAIKEAFVFAKTFIAEKVNHSSSKPILLGEEKI